METVDHGRPLPFGGFCVEGNPSFFEIQKILLQKLGAVAGEAGHEILRSEKRQD